jgi:hypothetical protein
MTNTMLYRAEGLAPLAAISDDGPLMETLRQVMLGWRIVPAGDNVHAANAAVEVRRVAGGWTCTGVTFDKPVTYADPVATACSLIATLYKAHTLVDRESLILHAAGVRIGAGLVLLTGHYRAGKTVFTTACAAAGLQIYSDDIIQLDPEGPVACAAGLAMRLRLPLPDSMTDETRAFIAAHRIAASDRYAYIRPPRNRLAWYGERAPIRGVVSLRRAEEGSARLQCLDPGDALSEAIRRNFAREMRAGKILDTFDTLTARVPCLSLAYSRAEEGVELMRQAFEGPSPEIAEQAPARSYRRKRRSSAPLSDQTRLSRAPGVSARERGDQAFLTDAGQLVIFNLNPTGSAVWRALEQPVTFGELTRLFAAAFPDHDSAELAVDLSSLIRELTRGGLVTIE